MSIFGLTSLTLSDAAVAKILHKCWICGSLFTHKKYVAINFISYQRKVFSQVVHAVLFKFSIIYSASNFLMHANSVFMS